LPLRSPRSCRAPVSRARSSVLRSSVCSCFSAPGRTGLMPAGRNRIAREGDVVRRFPSAPMLKSWCSKQTRRAGASASAARRLPRRREADELREYTERSVASARRPSARSPTSSGEPQAVSEIGPGASATFFSAAGMRSGILCGVGL
jgi:hypothetical protein